MKRIFLLTMILFFSVLSTACVNNLAIQELNNKAQEYMEKGDTDSAICRLEASLDLDNNIFETQYNLGIAYLNAKKYDKAVETLKRAIDLQPQNIEVYYSYAIAVDENNSLKIDKIKNPQNYVENNDKIILNEDSTIVKEKAPELSEENKIIITQATEEIIDAYNKYLDKNPKAEEKESIESRISSLKASLDFNSAIQ